MANRGKDYKGVKLTVKTEYEGVYEHIDILGTGRTNHFKAVIRVKSKVIFNKCFITAKEAALARDKEIIRRDLKQPLQILKKL